MQVQEEAKEGGGRRGEEGVVNGKEEHREEYREEGQALTCTHSNYTTPSHTTSHDIT